MLAYILNLECSYHSPRFFRHARSICLFCRASPLLYRLSSVDLLRPPYSLRDCFFALSSALFSLSLAPLSLLSASLSLLYQGGEDDAKKKARRRRGGGKKKAV
jgi:hypothetical protein